VVACSLTSIRASSAHGGVQPLVGGRRSVHVTQGVGRCGTFQGRDELRAAIIADYGLKPVPHDFADPVKVQP